jgi:hypothetical protein
MTTEETNTIAALNDLCRTAMGLQAASFRLRASVH